MKLSMISKCLGDLHRLEVTSSFCSQDIVIFTISRENRGSMPRAIQSAPATLANETAALASAPVPASHASVPRPNANQASKLFVDSAIPIEDVPCFTQGSFGAGAVIYLTRVVLETGNSFEVGSRHDVACELCWVPTKVPTHLGAETCPQLLEAREKNATFVRVGASPGRTASWKQCGFESDTL